MSDVKTWDDFDSYKSTVEGLQQKIDTLIEEVSELTIPYPLQQKDKAQQYLGYANAELGKLLFDTENNLKADIGEKKEEVVEEPPVEPLVVPPPPIPFNL